MHFCCSFVNRRDYIQWQQYCTGCHAMVIVSRCVLSCTEPMGGDKPMSTQDQGSETSTKTIRRRSCLSCWYNHNRQRPTAGVCMRLSTDTGGVKLVINKRYDIMYQHWKVPMLTTAAYDGKHSVSIKLTKVFSS